MAKRRPKGTWQLVLFFIIAAAIWALDQRREQVPVPEKRSAGAPAGAYEEFTGCVLREHQANDGDSFRVALPDGRVEEFRLYFVDAPESRFRTYSGGATNHERIREQAAALEISDDQAVEIGQQAKSRVHDLLAGRPFVIYTNWDDPFGDRRYHAFVKPEGGTWLHETLVREGLARIHTKGADLPDGTPMRSRRDQLKGLEAEAKRARRGAWGL